MRVPMQSLSSALHADYRQPTLDYETLLRLTRRLTGDEREDVVDAIGGVDRRADRGERLDGGLLVAAHDELVIVRTGEGHAVPSLGAIIHATPQADRLQLTELDAAFDGDTHFPTIDPQQWRETARDAHRDETGPGYAFVTYTRTRR